LIKVRSVTASLRVASLVSLDSATPVFRQGCLDHMGDKATSVHKVSENEKNL